MSRVWAGRPYPLGASFDGRGVNFALFSAHATRVELCLFDPSNTRELERIDLPEYTDEVYHGYLPDIGAGQLYGYRVHGPYAPEAGHRFNPAKLLLDPYARKLGGSLQWSNAHFGYRIGGPREDLTPDRRDNARGMYKAVVVDETFTWGGDRPPGTRFDQTVVYEAHVKGLSKRHPEVPPYLQGTYAGLGHPAVVDHMVRLGITAVELLPVHAFPDDRHLLERGLRNYWGYNTLGFFAPEPRYASGPDAPIEFKTMVRRLHDAGIEVILDVVYNHTAEGNHMGPTLSFRGIDNASYYRLVRDNPRYYDDVTGTGNSLNVAHPRVLQMVMDSLRYWVEVMHVDGFRFDLATTLGRETHGWDPTASFFDAIRQDPVLANVKLIAEPWDVGDGGYRLGGHGPGWSEWNDKYRDTVRAFWRSDEAVTAELATRIMGSADLFAHQGRRPWATTNFITAHDGFCLDDLVSYNDKHNEANGEGNRDGHSHNLSWNCGVEGPTDDPSIMALRQKQKRNLLTTLLFSQGMPMILAGDEFGNSQHGNNNVYCQDSEIGWLDWPEIDDHDQQFFDFARRVIALRKEHPVFRRAQFMHGSELSPHGVPDVSWYRPEGGRMDDGNWHEPLRRTIGMMLCGDAGVHRPPEGPPVVDATFLLLLNAAPEDVDFVMPAAVKDGWRRLLDSAEPEVIDDGRFWREGDTFPLEARSLALFVEGDGRTRDTATHRMPFGAEIVPGGVHFRFWAPGVDRVDLVLGADGDERRLPMQQAPGGWFDLTTEAAGAGMVYGFGLPDGMVVPDPASRGQAEDCDGRSLVVDPDAFNWRNQEWRGRPWHEAVIMELHIGTLTAEGTFDAARRELPRLQKLGITAIQIMPLADFKGSRNWGYDGVLPYAPDRSYGSTSALKALVDQAHRLGMQVFLDVVYNHFGPVGNYLHAYAPQFFREDISTPWGAAIDFRRPEVRDFFIHNALYWLEEYRFDGLRLDAVHAIHDDSETHFLDALAAAVHQRYGNLRDIHLILENEENDADRLADVYRAQWNDDIHHCLHVLATGETEAYYADYADRPAARLGRALAEGFVFQGEPMAYREGRPRGKPSAGLPPTRFVAFAQNHDQIGNRAKGDRLSLLATPDALRAVMDVLLLAPQIPMLFMGEAYASRRPFCFFTDFGGELGEAVREGRRREFARFAAFADPERRAQIPDPEAPETFEASKLDPAELEQDTQGAMYAHVRRLLTLRRQHIVPYLGDAAGHSGTFETIGERGLSVAWTLGTERRLTMLAQMGDEAGHGFVRPAGELVHVSDDTAMGELARGTLPPWSVAVFLTGEPGSES